MARDPDGKPIETRGRRSVSQKTRDLADQLKSLGTLFEGSPRILETALTGIFFGAIVYFLRPKIIVLQSADTFKPKFRGTLIDGIQFAYPDVAMGKNLAVLSALIVAPNLGGDIGSIIAPAGTALVFKTFMDVTFPENDVVDYARIFTDLGRRDAQGNLTAIAGDDATLLIYTRYVIPRYLRALFVASFFYIVLRYVRHLGSK